MLVLLLVIVVTLAKEGLVEIALQKSVFIPGGGYSVLNISNNVSQLNGDVMSGNMTLSIIPVSCV
jgi:hypothetical protein